MTGLPFSDIITFFHQNSGIALYHLTVSMVAVAALATLLFRRPRQTNLRSISVCLLIFSIEMASLLLDTGILGRSFTGSPFAGVVDRALLLSTALLFGWSCLFPNRSGLIEWVFGIAGAVSIGIGLAASWILLPANTPGWINDQSIGMVWDGIIAVWISIFLLGLLIAALRGKLPIAWGLAFFGLFLMLAGTGLQIAVGPQEIWIPGLSRFFNLWAFPLLLMRLALSGAPSSTILGANAGSIRAQESARDALSAPSPFLLHSLRQASAESSPLLADLFDSGEDENFVRSLTSWLCKTARAEVAYLLASSDEGQTLVFLSGHDCVNARNIPGFVVPTPKAKKLSMAIDSHRILSFDSVSAELQLDAIAHESGLPHAGPGVFAPLGDAGENLGGILLLSPYSGTDWPEGIEPIMAAYGKAVTGGMRFIIARAHLRHALEEARGACEQSSAERDTLRTQQSEWVQKMQAAEESLAAEQKRAAALSTSSTDQPGWQKERTDLLAQTHQLEDQLAEAASRDRERNSEVEKLRADSSRLKDALYAIASHQAETDRLRGELDSVRQELEQLKNRSDSNHSSEAEAAQLRKLLSESEARVTAETARLTAELERRTEEYSRLQSALLQPPQGDRPAEGLSHSDLSMMSSLISELRQPMSSAVGYTDLLLSESAGILGALQRKFLERIRAGITRMEALLDDLLQLALLADTTAAPRHSPVEISNVIDTALTASSETIRERNLIVRMDIADTIPPADIDHDALQQIVNHLVQNAALATPPEKEISITANLPGSIRESQGALLLTVQDAGAGITPEDQPRVFTRLYRNEGPLIEGVGDAGVGMAVARTLTEAMGGRIWMESQMSHGTTFFVLLPWRSVATSPVESR
jgi:signal transduction histidine kinase